MSCHFWHEEQENGYIFKPNIWEFTQEGETLKIEDAPGVESEAQKCHGDLNQED